MAPKPRWRPAGKCWEWCSPYERNSARNVALGLAALNAAPTLAGGAHEVALCANCTGQRMAASRSEVADACRHND